MSVPAPAFVDLLNEQIGHEFAAHQQYVAIAVYYDSETLPRLASFFYAQALEERNHAMMMVQYLDRRRTRARSSRASPRRRSTSRTSSSPSRWRSTQEKRVTEQINALASSPARGRLHLRAVHAVVHQGAGRGGRHDVRPAEDRAARQGQPAARRGVPGPRVASATAATTRPRLLLPEARCSSRVRWVRSDAPGAPGAHHAAYPKHPTAQTRRPNQRSESPPPSSSRTTAPPANAAVTSRSSCSVPTRAPRSS